LAGGRLARGEPGGLALWTRAFEESRIGPVATGDEMRRSLDDFSIFPAAVI
jgi:hypothetical protein